MQVHATVFEELEELWPQYVPVGKADEDVGLYFCDGVAGFFLYVLRLEYPDVVVARLVPDAGILRHFRGNQLLVPALRRRGIREHAHDFVFFP